MAVSVWTPKNVMGPPLERRKPKTVLAGIAIFSHHNFFFVNNSTTKWSRKMMNEKTERPEPTAIENLEEYADTHDYEEMINSSYQIDLSLINALIEIGSELEGDLMVPAKGFKGIMISDFRYANPDDYTRLKAHADLTALVKSLAAELKITFEQASEQAIEFIANREDAYDPEGFACYAGALLSCETEADLDKLFKSPSDTVLQLSDVEDDVWIPEACEKMEPVDAVKHIVGMLHESSFWYDRPIEPDDYSGYLVWEFLDQMERLADKLAGPAKMVAVSDKKSL